MQCFQVVYYGISHASLVSFLGFTHLVRLKVIPLNINSSNDVFIKIYSQASAILKGQCHEDFAVLGQFCAKIISLKLYSWTKCFCKARTKISNEFYQPWLSTINF